MVTPSVEQGCIIKFPVEGKINQQTIFVSSMHSIGKRVSTVHKISFLKVAKKLKPQLSVGTITVNEFWNSEGVIRVVFLPRGIQN